jgi:hypothetical protein
VVHQHHQPAGHVLAPPTTASLDENDGQADPVCMLVYVLVSPKVSYQHQSGGFYCKLCPATFVCLPSPGHI